MIKTEDSKRVKEIERKWRKPLSAMLYDWHWNHNLRHREIAERINIPRPTVTRWFNILKVPTQSCVRFTNLNLLNVGHRKGPRAYPKEKREFLWKFNKDFFKKWSPEMAYVLGFLFADGYVQRNSRGSSYFCFTSTDLEIIEKIREVLGSNHTIGVRSRKAKNPTWKDSYVLQIGSKELFENLENFGVIRNKSLVVKFPNIPHGFLGDFVRGYFDGDGCAHLGRYWRKDRSRWKWQFATSFTSGSHAFLLGLWKTLRQKRCVNGGRMGSKKGGYELVFSQNDSLALFNLMYNNGLSSNLFLERKREIFEKAFEVLNMRA